MVKPNLSQIYIQVWWIVCTFVLLTPDENKINWYLSHINILKLIIHSLIFICLRSGKLAVPEWVDLVKDGPTRELAPESEDWFYTRTASIARHLYMRSPVGIGSIRKIYGGNTNLIFFKKPKVFAKNYKLTFVLLSTFMYAFVSL